MAIMFFHAVLEDETEDENIYRGETWAENAGEELGHIKWHADGHTVFIDYIGTNGRSPLLGVRLLKALLNAEKQSLDPGLTNNAGRRLWWLFKARYSC